MWAKHGGYRDLRILSSKGLEYHAMGWEKTEASGELIDDDKMTKIILRGKTIILLHEVDLAFPVSI